jgi:hypothetical protein
MSDSGVVDADLKPAPWPWISAVVLDGEAVLYDEHTGRVHHLNPSGTIVWRLLDGEATIAEIAAAIAEAAGAEVDVVVADVVGLVTMLGQLGVIVGIDPAAVEPPSP